MTPATIGKLSFVHDRIYARTDAAEGEAGTLRAVIAGLRQRVAAPRSARKPV